MEPLTRYLGITGFTMTEQITMMREVLNLHRSHRTKIPLRLQVGVMISRRALDDPGTTWPSRFPDKDTIRKVFSLGGVMNCLHYWDPEGVNVTANLTKALAISGRHTTALQLDMVWPDPVTITDALGYSPKCKEIILRVDATAVAEVGNDLVAVAAKVATYQGVISHVLLGSSPSEGKALQAETLIPYAEAIRSVSPGIGLAFDGGLGPETTHLAAPLLEHFPEASFAMEGQLRSSGRGYDPVDWIRAYTAVSTLAKKMTEQ